MTIVIMATKKIFNNPNKIAVESLELSVNNDGVVRSVRAIDPAWVTKRELAVFSPAPSGPTVAIGELKAWQENTQCFLDDLKWLLTLEYHKFWSHVVFYPPCMDMVVSFLQEAYPPYLPPHPDNAVMDLYSEAYKKVLTIFSRLVTNKESEIEWMSASYLGKLIYDKFIFTIPIIFDLCLLYGTNNSTHISKLIKTVFQLQPKYNDDLTTALTFLKQIFSFIALQIDNRNNMDVVPPTLPGIFKGFSQSFGGLRSQVTAVKTLSLTSLHDLALHLVDCTVTLRLFLEVYPPSRQVLRENEFYASIVNIYENTLPFMYEKVVELGDPKKEPYNEIFNQLDLIRAEFIDIYRFIIVTTIDDILSGGPNVENSVNSFLTIITDSLSEKYFIKDYNSLHPVEVDLDVLCQAYDQMDLVKYDFIIQAIITTCYDDDDGAIPPTTKQNGEIINGHQEEALPVELLDKLMIEPIQGSDIPQEAKTQSLISEVKDILPHLGDGFILKCLEHLNFNSERVINSVLEGTLDESLQALDPSLPIIPQDALDTQYLETGIDRLNVFDNDEFDVMTRDNIDLSKVHKGKRKPKHKNLSEMLNDKSHVKEMKDTYTKYSLVSDDVDMYEDEYDDTYDGDAPVLVSDGNAEADKKLLFKRAPLRESGECLAESEDSDDEPGPSGNMQPKDSFCVNPEEVRARYQALRDFKYGNKHPQRDVVGKAKGQGQDKDVLISRQKKAANKSQSGNHNRRSGAQWKRNQGVLPS